MSINNAIKDMNEVLFIVENNVDPYTGEILDWSEELETIYFDRLQSLKDNADAIGFGIVSKEKEIEALQIMKASIDKKIKAKKNAIERTKGFLGKLASSFGVATGKNNTKTLVGEVIKIKDTSKYEYELDCLANKKDQQYKVDDYPDDFKVAVVSIPISEYRKIESQLDQHLLSLSLEVNKDKLIEAFDVKEPNDPNSKIIQFDDLKGIKKVWKDNSIILGLKKLGE